MPLGEEGGTPTAARRPPPPGDGARCPVRSGQRRPWRGALGAGRIRTKQMPALRRGTKVHTLCGRHRMVTTVTLSSCRTWAVGLLVPSRPQPMARHCVPWGSCWSCSGSWATATWVLRLAGRSSWGRTRVVGGETLSPGRMDTRIHLSPEHPEVLSLAFAHTVPSAQPPPMRSQVPSWRSPPPGSPP